MAPNSNRYLGFILGIGVSLTTWLHAATVAVPACTDVELSSKSASEVPVAFDPWKFEAGNLRVHPQQMLPTVFLKKIEEKFGPIEIKVNNTIYDKTPTIEIWAHAKERLIAEFVVQPGPPMTDSLVIHGLRIENPLQTVSNEKLGQDQLNKGLPLPVFRYAVKQVFELVKASGYKNLFSYGSQNYSVLTLYRKLVRMQPADSKSKATLDMLDQYYDWSRTLLPAAVQVKSLQEFSALLGGTKTKHNTSEMLQIWTDYQAGKTDDHQIQPILGKDGKIFAVWFWPGKPNQTISFIDRHATPQNLVEWNDLAGKNATQLILEIPL